MSILRGLILLVVLAYVALAVDVRVRAAPTPPPIGFVGDSITAMGTPFYATAHPVIEGRSGSDTTAWLPANPNRFLSRAIAVFHMAHVRVVSVMLGTNDASRYMRPTRYHAQLARIMRALTAAGFRVVVQKPPYMDPSRPGITSAMDRLLLAYWGRSPAYAYFQTHPDQLSDGVHPTVTGMRALGAIWAAALAQS
jgi:lysophospholipase L1-like esterase